MADNLLTLAQLSLRCPTPGTHSPLLGQGASSYVDTFWPRIRPMITARPIFQVVERVSMSRADSPDALGNAERVKVAPARGEHRFGGTIPVVSVTLFFEGDRRVDVCRASMVAFRVRNW